MYVTDTLGTLFQYIAICFAIGALFSGFIFWQLRSPFGQATFTSLLVSLALISASNSFKFLYSVYEINRTEAFRLIVNSSLWLMSPGILLLLSVMFHGSVHREFSEKRNLLGFVSVMMILAALCNIVFGKIF